MIHLSGIDILLIVIYFLSVLYVGFRAVKRTKSNTDDYLLAGRSLTLPVFIMTLVSTWYGGILGVGEFSYRFGISSWFVQGLPYYFFAAVFAVFLAKKIRETNLFTIPDKLYESYDQKTAIFGAILTFILMTPAPYVLMLSVILQMLFGWDLFISLVVIAVFAVSYLYWGGFHSDIQTDILEFCLMFIGFATILPFCFLNYGGVDFLKENLPETHLIWHGGNPIQFLLVWFLIALWTLVDPAFHQRCYAAKDPQTAQRGILLSIVFWFIFDTMTAFAGLYSRAIVPNLQDPIMAYPMLAEKVLPPIAKGLFYIGILATIMSTLNTLALVSAQTLGRDIIARAKNLMKEESSILKWTKFGLVFSFLLAVILAILTPSVIKIWYTIGTITIPGLLVPILASYFKIFKINSRFAFLCMILGFGLSLFWFVGSFVLYDSSKYLLNLEPMLPGLIMSLMVWFVGRMKEIKKL